jgi:hypothetical protein
MVLRRNIKERFLMPRISKIPTYIKDALKINELAIDLENISTDDKKKITDYSIKEIVNEAKYVLSCYNEGGHSLNEDLESEDVELRKRARKEVKQLEKYIQKYQNIFTLVKE